MQIGIPGCDVDVACQLACYGFGDSLLQAALMLPFLQFMEYIANWCRDLCDALSTDPCGYLQQLHHGLAQVIQSELLQFPDLPALALYASPLTSWSMLRFHRNMYFSLTIVFLLRVRSWTLCAQWMCHILPGLAYLVLPFPVSRATGSCTRTFPFPFRMFSYLYQYELTTRHRILVCFPFPLWCCRLVSLCLVLTSFSVCVVDSSPYVSCLCLSPLCCRLVSMLTFTAYAFPFVVCRLVSHLVIFGL